MESKILQQELKDGTIEDFYPITHVKAVLVNEEVNLYDYLKEILKSAPHVHPNMETLDIITKEYINNKEKQIENIEKKITRIKTKQILDKSMWYGDEAPYKYTVEVPNCSIDSDVSLMVSDDISIEEYNAYKNADITITSSGIGTGVVVLTAFGEKPNVDIPIAIVTSGIY